MLAGLGGDSPLTENLMTTAIIAAIVAIGMTKGLGVLEMLESWALYVTLVIIALLLLGFGYYDMTAWRSAGGIRQSSN